MAARAPDAESTTDAVAILVVDDHAENRTALRAILAGPQYEIVEAGSGPEALRQLLEEEFAVLLVDVVMPGMNGFELAEAVKRRKRTASLPILFLTAQATELELVYKAYQAGAVDYLVKPLVPEMVRAKVSVFAELYRQRKRIERQGALLVEAERNESELRILELRLADERRYRALAEAVPHIVWTATPDGVVDYFNQRWFEYTGTTQREARGSWDRVVHPDDLAESQRAWRAALVSGDTVESEARLRSGRDGKYRWHLCRAVPERSPTGQILSWLGTFTDIEEQKRVQAVLAEFKGTLDAVLDAVFIFDPNDWRFLYVNQGASMLTGFSAEELARMHAVDFLSEHDESGFRELLAPLRDGSKAVINMETEIKRRNARTVPVEVSIQYIHIDGGRVVSIARDITERRRNQLERELLYKEAVDAIRTRDEFLSVASHELKTPLSALQMQIEMILRSRHKNMPSVLSPEQETHKLEKAGRQIERLTRLIAELMDVSRITAGRLRLEMEELDLSATVRDVVGRLSEETARAHCAVELQVDVPIVGRWDRIRLEQVITNLVTNACKFGAGHPIEIAVEQAGARARMSITDHGIGIAADDVERIFQRYEQAISSRAYGGLGLGLYIARQIIDAHGGTIRVESQVGAGSTFTIELPREPAPTRKEEGGDVLHDDEGTVRAAREAHPDR
jgi:PAS domain S-box-containing protein